MFGFNFGLSSSISKNNNCSNNNNNHSNNNDNYDGDDDPQRHRQIGSPTSPNRNSVWGSPFSPFRATNAPLPDITIDNFTPPVFKTCTPAVNSNTQAMGGGVQASVAPGRTMRDYEEQLSETKKENFNLKLRIYLLEERMNLKPEDRDLLKKDLELRLENETLKKEVQEKQALLSQAAQAIKLIEDQKKEVVRSKSEYQQLFEEEQEKTHRLEQELEEYRAKLNDSQHTAEMLGLTTEQILEFNDRLHQYEEIRSSLEAELKQLTTSLEEERNWAAELESERDGLKERLESEIQSKESYAAKKDQELENLKKKVREIEDQLFQKDKSLQQLRKEMIDKDKAIKEKNEQLEERCRAYEEVTEVADKRKRQVDQLRLSLKSREETILELHNKNRTLVSQTDLSCGKRIDSPRSSMAFSENEWTGSKKSWEFDSPKRSYKGSLDWDPCLDRTRFTYDLPSEIDTREIEDLKKKIADGEKLSKEHEAAQQQLRVQLAAMTQQDTKKAEKLQKLQLDYRKALIMIKGFVSRKDEIDSKESKQAKLIMELESENARLRNELAKSARGSTKKELFVDNHGQQRLQDMDYKIDDLRDQIDSMVAERSLLEKQTQIESEELRDRLQDRELKIEYLECERNSLKDELQEIKEELQKLKEAYNVTTGVSESPILGRPSKSPVQKSDQEHAQLNSLITELRDFGIQVTFANDLVQLNYEDSGASVDLATMIDYVKRLAAQRSELEKEINQLKWSRLETKSLELIGAGDGATGKNKKYCEVLRTHLKDLMKFMRDMQQDSVCNKNDRLVFEILANSRMLSDDFINALENSSGPHNNCGSENTVDNQRQTSTPSDSEVFSEPDRTVSFARIGLQTSSNLKSPSDSEDSMEYQMSSNDFDANRQLAELKDINNFLLAELTSLRKDVVMAEPAFDPSIDGKLAQLMSKLESSQKHCEKLRLTIEKKIHECCTLKKQSKQTSVRKAQLEKRIQDAENLASEVTKQKAELLQYLENVDRQSAEMMASLNKENEMMRTEIKKLEEEIETAKATIVRLTKELDLLTLKHTQTVVENSKVSNEKLRLEQELRKAENKYEIAVKHLQNKFHREVSDLNQINESHRVRMQELEANNKELRRHVVACEASDSAPSSSGISSIPPSTNAKHSYDELPSYHNYNISPWLQLPTGYNTASSGRSKSSCSPDLGIESDGALSSLRPLKDSLKISQSIVNLFSDDENCNGNKPALRDTDSESPIPLEGLDEVEVLKQENEALKRRLLKTRRALEDTFQHLSTSNKNKKNVEKAITKQLMITKSILKKTRNYDDVEQNYD